MSEVLPTDGGSASIEWWDDEPACTFDPERGFQMNSSSVDTLRWYTYLRRDDEDAAGLLQSKNDD
jgi:hypothetical protein